MAVFTCLLLTMPLLSGVLFSVFLLRQPLWPPRPHVIGYGLLTGMFLASLSLRLLDLSGVPLTVVPALVLNAALLLTVVVLVRRHQSAAVAKEPPVAASRAGRGQKALALILLLLAALHLLLATTDALVRPLFGWDATMHWATKAKVWFDQAQIVEFVSNEAWLERGPAPNLFTDHHPAYPPTVPLLQVWMALSVGFWSETIVNWPWPLFGVALALIFYGESRELGASALCASVFTYLLISLPLVTAHIAMAGYADLPLATCYLAALLCTARGIQTRDARRVGQGLFFAIMCTQLKNEGFFWALTLLPAAMVLLMPFRTLLVTLLIGLGGVIVSLLILPADVTVAGHSLQGLELAYRDGAASALLIPFQRGTWNLLGLLVLLVPLALALSRGEDRLLLAVSVAIGSAVSLYLILFTMTRFAYGAIHLSASSRIALHLMPGLALLCLLAWLQICRWSGERTRAPGAGPGPACAPEVSDSGKQGPIEARRQKG